jgi:hypothetical protein
MSTLAMSHPRNTVLAIVGKLVLTATHAFLVNKVPVAHAAVTLAVFLVLTWAAWVGLPYYRKVVNSITGAFWLGMTAVSAPMIAAATISSESSIPAIVLGVAVIPVCAGGFFLFLFHCRTAEKPLTQPVPAEAIVFEK